MTRTMLLAMLLLGASCTGCASYLPFSHEIRSEHALGEKDLQRLQFYLSEDVVLRRELRRRGREIRDGELKLVSGKEVEEVVIEKHTPGVIVDVAPRSLTVSFDEGSSLTFALRGGAAPLPLRKVSEGEFAEPPPDAFPADGQSASERIEELVGHYYLTGEGGEVVFHGKRWELAGDSIDAHLLIDAETLEEESERRTTLDGRRL